MSNEVNEFPVFDYSSNKVKIHGAAKIKLTDLKDYSEKTAYFVVVDDTFEPILGLDACVEFGLLKRIDIDSI